MIYRPRYRYGSTTFSLVEAPSEILARNGLTPSQFVKDRSIRMVTFFGKEQTKDIYQLHYTYYENAYELRYWSSHQAIKLSREPEYIDFNRDVLAEYLLFKKFVQEKKMTKEILKEFTYEGFSINV